MSQTASGRWQSIARPVLGVFAALAVMLMPAAAQAKPKPHVWLHYDYLVYPDGHSDAPDPAAIQLVVDAYAAHGVLLEVDDEHAAIPTSNPIVGLDTTGGSCPGALSFSALKEQHFNGHSGHEWHYVIFGGDVTSVENECLTGSSGMAELPGDDFVIAMNTLRGGPPVAERRAVAGTFMHELGHTLNLRHGGGDDANYKPNYLSVMNYAFQLTGIINTLHGRRTDYSDSALPTLDQMHLDETVGVQGQPGDLTKFGHLNEFGFFAAPAEGPIDWDLDGDGGTETDVAVDLYIEDPSGQPPRFLTGFDDWAAVRGYLAGVAPSAARARKSTIVP